MAVHAPAQQASQGHLHNPFFVFDDGLGGGPPEREAALAKQIGFAGISFDRAELIPERLKAVDSNGLQFFYVYLAATVGKQEVEFEPGFENAIAALKGRNTVVWLTIRGKGPNAEAQAIEAARRTADLAAASNLRVALYPHYGFYVQTMRQALQIASHAERSNLGVTFNLCHELRSGLGGDVAGSLKSALPRLWAVSINGADRDGENWDRLIQPLDSGTFDTGGFLRTLDEIGYRGPIGLQCYAIKGEPKTLLQRSMTAWLKFSKQDAATQRP